MIHGDFNVLSPLVQNFPLLKNYFNFFWWPGGGFSSGHKWGILGGHRGTYREEQRLAQKKWLQNNPDYWKKYRRKNQEKTNRNRSLQKIRNMRRENQADLQPCKTIGIAKMDARKANKNRISGQYWLVPMIAKMDAVEIFITSIPGS